MKAGIFRAKVIEAAICRTTSNTDYIGIVFEVVEGDEKGERINGSLYWTEKTEEGTKKALAGLGWEGEVTRDAALVGLKNIVPIGVIEDTYNGKTRLKVDWVIAPMTGINAKDRLTMRDAQSVLDSMRRGIGKGQTNGTSRRQPPANQGDAYEGPDGDI